MDTLTNIEILSNIKVNKSITRQGIIRFLNYKVPDFDLENPPEEYQIDNAINQLIKLDKCKRQEWGVYIKVVNEEHIEEINEQFTNVYNQLIDKYTLQLTEVNKKIDDTRVQLLDYIKKEKNIENEDIEKLEITKYVEENNKYLIKQSIELNHCKDLIKGLLEICKQIKKSKLAEEKSKLAEEIKLLDSKRKEILSTIDHIKCRKKINEIFQ